MIQINKLKTSLIIALISLFFASSSHASDSSLVILVNQVAYNADAPKMAVVSSHESLPQNIVFQIIDSVSSKPVFTGHLQKSQQVKEWHLGTWFSRIDFSAFNGNGRYFIMIEKEGKTYMSFSFLIGASALSEIAVPAITRFFYHQRASSPEELEADRQILLYGSDKSVDLRGGWCDASGDVSKYFSHLRMPILCRRSKHLWLPGQ